ncbi:MAG: DUF6263 family protein [Phycisphaerae bacterium]
MLVQLAKKPGNVICAMIAACLVAAPAAAAADAIMIKRSFKSGTKHYVQHDTSIDQTITGNPMGDMKAKVKRLNGLWEEVKEASSDKSTVHLEFARSMYAVESPMFTAEYDTDDPENEDADPQIRTILQNVVGGKMTMGVDAKGQMTGFEGMNELAEAISKKAVMNMHWQQMQHEFTDEAAGNAWGKGRLMLYPNRKVKVGEKWEGNTEEKHPMLGTLITNNVYELKEIRSNGGSKLAVIGVTTTVSRKESEQKGPGPEPELSGTSTGEAIYDAAQGMVTSVTSTGDVKISFAIPNMPEGTPPMNANMVVSSKTTVMSVKERMAEAAEAAKRTEARIKAAEEEDDEDEDDDE